MDGEALEAALFGEGVPAPPAAAAAPIAQDALFGDDAPVDLNASRIVAVAPDGGRRARVLVAVVALLLVLGFGGVAYAVFGTSDDGTEPPKVELQGTSATSSASRATTTTAPATTAVPTTTTAVPTTTTAPTTTDLTPDAPAPGPRAGADDAPVVTDPPVFVPPPTAPPTIPPTIPPTAPTLPPATTTAPPTTTAPAPAMATAPATAPVTS